MDDQTQEQEAPELMLAEPHDVPTFYSNLCGIATSAEEVIFTFAQRDLEDPTHAMAVVRIYTSPGHAKRIADVLTRVMEQHREQAIQALPVDIRNVVEKQSKRETRKAKKSAPTNQ